MNSSARTLVVVATYNEIENLPRLTDEIFVHAPDAQVLVIDDNSPDGTGRWSDQRAGQDDRVHCIHRPAKLGLGTATVAGFRYALSSNFDLVITMDADFSHHPKYLPQLRRALEPEGREPVDVAVGSRYVRGGGVEGWPWYRRLMSRGVNWYARLALGLSVADCSGAFRCYRTEVLRRLDLDSLRSQGYSYLEEILWVLQRQGARFNEIPILFVDRKLGQTKISWYEVLTSLVVILKLGGCRLFRMGAGAGRDVS